MGSGTPLGGRGTASPGEAAPAGAAGTPARTGSPAGEKFGERSRSRSRGGAGLGLAIAGSIAEGHGGGIEAGSQPGQGATFTVRWQG
ncbi:MAG: sensor histidine kinase [Chloroflexi bacterium]|nr:sensor histidine kinase [Chloroflexota bacterium]